MLTTLPHELQAAIVRALDRDLDTLRNAALVCHALLPVVREELFYGMNILALEQPYMLPYSHKSIELWIKPRLELWYPRFICEYRFVPHLVSERFPRLRCLHFVALYPTFYIRLPLSFFDALTTLGSVTELTLSRASFVNLWQVQSIICSLPNLSRLFLDAIEYNEDPSVQTRGCPIPRDLYTLSRTRPRLSWLAMAPSQTSSISADVASWIANGPSRETLSTLVVPHQSNAPVIALSHFGRNIEYLMMPLRGLDRDVYRGFLGGYTDLRAITIFLEAYSTSEGPWYLLVPFLERGIPANHLHTITIDVRVGYAMSLASAINWAVLDRLNDALVEDKFDALRKVVFLVQWEENPNWHPGWAERRHLVQEIERRLYDLDEAGRLETRVHQVKQFYDTAFSG